MESSKVIELAAIAGPLLNSNRSLAEKRLDSVYQAIKDGKSDEILQKRVNKALTSDVDLQAKVDELVAHKKAVETRVKVSFSSYSELCEARKTRNIGREWDEAGTVVAYEYI